MSIVLWEMTILKRWKKNMLMSPLFTSENPLRYLLLVDPISRVTGEQDEDLSVQSVGIRPYLSSSIVG